MYVAIIAPAGWYVYSKHGNTKLKPQRGDMCVVNLIIADKCRVWKLLGLTQLNVHSPVVRRFIAEAWDGHIPTL